MSTTAVPQPGAPGFPGLEHAGDPSGTRAPHRVALKLSLGVALLGLVVFLGLSLVSGAVSWWLLPTPLILFFGTYWLAFRILGARLELARSVLNQIRKHRFDNLEAAHLPRGDELNDLIWQVYRTGQVLEKEMEELRRVETYRKEFLGNVSHELKTPIFAIRGFAETLQNGAIDDASVNRAFLDKILRNADRLSHLAKDLGEISRIETGELTMEKLPFSLHELIGEVVESLEPIARHKGVQVRNTVGRDLPDAVGDADHLRQVLVNLVDNAVKYNNPGGLVEIGARRLPDRRVKISIVDNGIGVAPEHLPRITERFYRVDKSRSRTQGGTGLGLAIVKHILAAHDTQLAVESRPGAGSTFGFTLETAE